MFDHYIGVDWAQSNMAIARMTPKTNKISTIEVAASVEELKLYLGELKGRKILTFEESTASQWLFTELKSSVEELIVCDPYRNHLLKEGAKSDKIDAQKLVQLLRAGLLKPVFHSGDDFIELRKIVSGYRDVVGECTRLKNRRTAMFHSYGMSSNEKTLSHKADEFVLEGLDRGIAIFQSEKLRYEKIFEELSQKHKSIRLLKTIPGIGPIGSVKIVAIVVEPKRFPSAGHFLSYCGLIKLHRMSGGKLYGKKSPRYCRTLKDVFKTAAITTIREGKNNPMRDYYLYLINEKKLAEHHARHAIARRAATLAYGILKTQKKFEPYRRKKKNESITSTDL